MWFLGTFKMISVLTIPKMFMIFFIQTTVLDWILSSYIFHDFKKHKKVFYIHKLQSKILSIAFKYNK